jgi:hypothetical protein
MSEETLFAEALARRDPAERAAFCGGEITEINKREERFSGGRDREDY